ncbi:MAG: hypothetical protein WC211_00605 [Dehalococcoidia bacterium]
MLDEAKADAVRDAAVAVMMATRSEYLRAGASALKHWDQLHDRFHLALRTSSTAQQLVTALRRGLRLSAPSSDSSAAAVALTDAMDADPTAYMDLLESEIGLVMARARLESERRRDARDASDLARMMDAAIETPRGGE